MLTLLLAGKNHTLLVISDSLEMAINNIGRGLRDIYQDDLVSYRYDVERQLLWVNWSDGSDFPVAEDLYQVSPLSSGDLLWLSNTGDSPVYLDHKDRKGTKKH